MSDVPQQAPESGQPTAAPSPATQADAQAEPRLAERDAFVAAAGGGRDTLRPLAGDASRRRYFRLEKEGRAAVLMDAPPEQGEDVRPFAAVTGHLRAAGFSAPEILHADLERGFLLLEDLGDAVFAREFAARPEAEPWLYQNAIDLLHALHQQEAPSAVSGYGADLAVAPYDWEALRREARLFVEWYLPGATGGAETPIEAADGFESALKTVCEETGADRFRDADARLTLRDYHAENLIWLPDRPGLRRVGLLDYQDALAGHPAYDLVSLLEDARHDVSPALETTMLNRYCASAGLEGPGRARFEARYAALGAQRNLKILGIFARLWLRDGKPKYIALSPRVWGYLERDLAHPALEPLRLWIRRWAPAPGPDVIAALRAAGPRRETSGPAPAAAPNEPIDAAMVLAAGLGTRMRPLTETTPKPLIPVGGRPLIEHALERISEIGVRRAVVNAHHLADQIHAFAGGWNYQERAPRLQVSDEAQQLMETGGGVVRALPLLDRKAFLVLNSDNLWTGDAPLKALTAGWDPERMDALLLLVPIRRACGYTRQGDFSLDSEGRLVRRGARPQAPLVYTGAQIVKASAFDLAPEGPFSMNVIWDQLIAVGRACGVHHLGQWADVGGLPGLKAAEAMLAEAAEGSTAAESGA